MKAIPTLKKLLATTGLLTAGLIFSAPSHSNILFQDNFDNDSSSTVLNFNSLLNWDVSGGTIDYIKDGDYGIRCSGSTGGCLDMDGSTGNAGRITSKNVFNFEANVIYTLAFQYSGNQRGGSNDTLNFGLDSGAGSSRDGITPNLPFTPGSLIFTYTVANSSKLFVEDLGGDNVGVILDNVVLSDNKSPSVPEPASLALVGLGLVGLGAVRRRHGK